jgi:large subunit ribosomal protein L4
MDLDPNIFQAPVRADLLHAVVVAQLAARRRGTHATRSRALVSGGGVKPYRQKGTGRARQGSIRAPQWTGGGIVFGPQPRSYGQHVPKKVRKAALRSALSLRNGEGALHLVDSLVLAEPKTRLLAQRLRQMGLDDVLIVTGARDRTLELAGRNLPRVRVLAAAGLNVYDVLARKHLIVTRDALGAIAERLQ